MLSKLLFSFATWAMVRLLLHSHVEPNYQGRFFGSPLATTAHFGYQYIVELLAQHGVANTMGGGYHGSVLMAADHCGKGRLVGYLLDCPSFKENSALVNRETRFGTTLQSAVAQHHIGIVQTLLHRGDDINAASKLYETALQPPSRLDHADMVNYLIEKGAKVDHVPC